MAGVVASPAHFALHLACTLLELAFYFLAFVAGDLAGDLFRGALDLILSAFGAILVHDQLQRMSPKWAGTSCSRAGVMQVKIPGPSPDRLAASKLKCVRVKGDIA